MKFSEIVSEGIKWSQDIAAGASPKLAGQFGRDVVLYVAGRTIDGSKLDLEFEVPFDDNLEADEATFVVYNLSSKTLGAIVYGAQVSFEAGYKGARGLIFSGYVSKVKTERDGVDSKTTINALDSMRLPERKIKSKAYAAGADSSTVLRDLILQTGLKIAVFRPLKQQAFGKAVTVEGDLFANIRQYADKCGVSAYINKGQAYVRALKDGDSTRFTLSASTGMIGSPEAFEEEVQVGGDKVKVKGIRVKCLLNPRITTASIITVNSLDYTGSYRVRGGKHYGGGSDFYTELEAIQ